MKVIKKEGGVPIKMWTDGVPVEDAALNQLGNVSMLPFIHSHVAVMPDVHWGMGATVGSVIATKGAVIPAAVGVDIGCFVGETRIPLLDGRQKTLAELERESEPFWVYSINSLGRIVPGRARCVRTRVDAELMRVIVSGGDEIVCTPDHRVMMNDGSYREARSLRFNDSLMPLYRKWDTRDGYERCNSGKGTGRQTHIMVWEAMNGPVPSGYVVHHSNHVHFDNRPTNLELMTVSEHSAHHRATGKTFRNSDPEFQRRRRRGIARRCADPVAMAKMVDVGLANITTFMRDRPEEYAAAVKDNGKRGAPYLADFNRTPRPCTQCDHVAANPSALLWHARRVHGRQDQRSESNHKVISVENLAERADVYCLQVEEHHNFALAAGVFVHNCGMAAVETTLKASDLPESLDALRGDIERAVPHGFVTTQGRAIKGSWEVTPNAVVSRWANLSERFAGLAARHKGLSDKSPSAQLGTLGGGNHFLELCLDTDQTVWVMLHSGSRGIGNRIGMHFIELAKEDMRRHFINLPDKDLAYLPEGTEHFDQYLEAMTWAQDYAAENRKAMLDNILRVMRSRLRPFTLGKTAVNCHHNYCVREHHFGENVLVTRKGAVRARLGDLGIIPGSMGAKSFIVRGKGNPDSFHSCSHGAGRKMSRTAAKKLFTLEDHAKSVEGVSCRIDEDVIDETPAAYKDIAAVMNAQRELVDVVAELKQVLCVKG